MDWSVSLADLWVIVLGHHRGAAEAQSLYLLSPRNRQGSKPVHIEDK